MYPPSFFYAHQWSTRAKRSDAPSGGGSDARIVIASVLQELWSLAVPVPSEQGRGAWLGSQKCGVWDS